LNFQFPTEEETLSNRVRQESQKDLFDLLLTSLRDTEYTRESFSCWDSVGQEDFPFREFRLRLTRRSVGATHEDSLQKGERDVQNPED